MLYYSSMPLSLQPVEPQNTKAIAETQATPVEAPILEVAETPETAPEKGQEVYVEGEPLPPGALPPPQETAAPQALTRETHPAPVEIPKDPIQLIIEKKLETGVAEAFSELEPLAQEAFKVEGENTGAAVRALLSAPKFDAKQVKRIFDLVRKWLSLLPNTNPWWVEQWAKAKTGALVRVRG